MDTISSFWAGAQDVAERLDLESLATAAGGWEPFSRCSVDDLVSLGVSLRVARAWLNAAPRTTLGVAVTRCHPHYPSALAACPSPPPVLFVDGATATLARRAVSVVGTRRCTPYGASVARHLGSALASAGMVVISGLARGIDTHAHRGALAQGATVAVLGHGLAHTAPSSNRSLRASMIAAEGAVLTVFPDEMPPARWTFPSRNRWIAALVADLIVVEAPKGSGALITADLAAQLGITVHVVPGPLGVSACRGSNELIQQGAQVVLGVDDLVAALTQTQLPLSGRPPWLDHVLAGGTVAEAARLARTSAVAILQELSDRELAGELVRLPGGRYASAGGGASPSNPSRP